MKNEEITYCKGGKCDGFKLLEQENAKLKDMYRLSCLKCEYKNTKADVDKYKSALQQIDDLLHNSEQKYNCIDFETVVGIKSIIKDCLYKNGEVK